MNRMPAPGADEQRVAQEEQAARRFLEKLGLEVVRPAGRSRFSIPATFDLRWRAYAILQQDVGINLDSFQGKEAAAYRFLLRNHPLEERFQGKANIGAAVWVVQGDVAGGLLYPVGKNGEGYYGLGYSLKGRTVEEIAGKSWLKIVDDWGRNQKGGSDR